MKYILFISLIFLLYGCGDKDRKNNAQGGGDMSRGAESGTQMEQGNQQTDTAHAHSAHLDDKGIGPVKEVKLGPIDAKLVSQGKDVFQSKCIVCHDLDNRKVGPPLRDVTDRLSPEFIMNYLLNTEEMQQKNEHLKALVSEYKTVMPDQDLSENDARALLEFFRQQKNVR